MAWYLYWSQCASSTAGVHKRESKLKLIQNVQALTNVDCSWSPRHERQAEYLLRRLIQNVFEGS